MSITGATRQWTAMKISQCLILAFILLAASQSLYAQDDQATNGKAAANPPPSAAQLTLDELRTFTDVFNLVRRNYVEKVGDKKLLEAAIKGMLTDLDPHAAYLPNNDFEDRRFALNYLK